MAIVEKTEPESGVTRVVTLFAYSLIRSWHWKKSKVDCYHDSLVIHDGTRCDEW